VEQSALPEASFVDPSGANTEAIRELADGVVDRLLTQPETADERSPLPAESTAPTATIPESAHSRDDLLSELELIVEGSMNPAHPGYIGHMDTVPTTVSVLGDLVTPAVKTTC